MSFFNPILEQLSVAEPMVLTGNVEGGGGAVNGRVLTIMPRKPISVETGITEASDLVVPGVPVEPVMTVEPVVASAPLVAAPVDNKFIIGAALAAVMLKVFLF